MNDGVAVMPMYDWPEARAAVDRLWAAIRDRLRASGYRAPQELSRSLGLSEGWTQPDLVLGQACGLPLVQELAGRVSLVGAADHGLPGCAPGWYRSAIVARADDPRRAFRDFQQARLAINDRGSQSGWGAILHHAAPLARQGRFFGAVTVTGAHVHSVDLVAAGEADIASIDLVTWGYCLRHRPKARELAVLMLTDPTPGLPYIAATGTDVAPLRQALAAAIADLPAQDRGAIGGMTRFVPMDVADYGLVADRFAAASAVLRD